MKKKAPPVKHKFVMLIDDAELDNFINQKIIEASLFAEKVYVTTGGTSALEFLRNLLLSPAAPELFPKVIFIDINMPIMDGFQFMKNLLNMKDAMAMKPKLVILTSSVSPMDREKAREISEEIVFLNKPLTGEMLAAI